MGDYGGSGGVVGRWDGVRVYYGMSGWIMGLQGGMIRIMGQEDGVRGDYGMSGWDYGAAEWDDRGYRALGWD